MSFVIVALVMYMNLRIRDLREDADLTQTQVAQTLLCDQSLYSKYERGERALPLDLAMKLAELYGVSMDYLVGREEKQPVERYRRIRDLREDADLTQAQVGAAIHVPQRTYAYYESGQRMIPPRVLCALADLYHVSVDYLLERTDRK